MATEETHDAIFDKIMEMVGNDGKFQKKFNYIFNVGLVFCASIVFMNIILAMNVPDHWCYVPGREKTNFTIDEWRKLTLPQEINSKDQSVYSTCQMYNVSLNDLANSVDWNFTRMESIACRYGHEYDKQWYEKTAVSQEDWICDKDLYQTNVFMFNRVGETVGTLFFGHLGDTFGRKVIYYVSLALLLGGRILSIVLSRWYTAFSIVIVLGSLTGMSIFQTPLVIAMETSKPDDRASIALYQSLAWSAGMCVLPLLFWWLRDWMTFLTVSTLPLAIFFFFPKYMIESPRWLVTRKQFDGCAKVLQHIAKLNGVKCDLTASHLQKMLPESNMDKVYGIASLFSSKRLALNTLLLVNCWNVCTVAYFVLVLYIAQLPGNPFLNFLGQSLVEVPSFIAGQYLSNRIGRRLTNALSFWTAAILCIPTILIADIPEWHYVFIAFTIIMKLCATVTFFAVNLQSMETYPTCLRQTGISFGAVVSSIVGICGPYIVYMGTHYDTRYPYILLCILFIIGGTCGIFLPETLHYKLPDSMEEARKFGADQKFWSIPRPQVDNNVNDVKDEEEIEKLNPSVEC